MRRLPARFCTKSTYYLIHPLSFEFMSYDLVSLPIMVGTRILFLFIFWRKFGYARDTLTGT